MKEKEKKTTNEGATKKDSQLQSINRSEALGWRSQGSKSIRNSERNQFLRLMLFTVTPVLILADCIPFHYIDRKPIPKRRKKWNSLLLSIGSGLHLPSLTDRFPMELFE